jgi:hypothetical protein
MTSASKWLIPSSTFDMSLSEATANGIIRSLAPRMTPKFGTPYQMLSRSARKRIKC